MTSQPNILVGGGGQRRISSPATFKHIVNQMESEFKPTRVEKDLERYIGKKMDDRRWRSIKLKYSMKEPPRERCVTTDVILKVNMRERLKSETRNY